MPDDLTPEKLDVESVVDWLVDGVRTVKKSEDILQELCDRLTDCGLRLHRVAVFVTTLHPNVLGRAFYWKKGEPVRVLEAPYEVMTSENFINSPAVTIMKEGKEIRRRLLEPDCPVDFPILEELKAEGVTDYIATPLDFTNGQNHAATYTSTEEGGFSEAEITAINRIRPALTRIAEIFALTRTAHNLLDSYLGHQSGAKVLRGQIKRGDGEDIHAVIWFCDLRNSTPLADSMGRDEFLGLLNDYFECVAGAVLDHDGEVLRYIGDAALAIFPVAEQESWTAEIACEKAVAAANDAMRRMRELNKQRIKDGKDELGYGIGLHMGHVMYGNIGTPDRIEFTVIGAAANEAARIEGMCKNLGVNFVLSADVRKHLRGDWKSLGNHALRGVGEEMEIFTVPDET